jgi:hypothetical protein
VRRFMIVLAIATTLATGAIGRAEGELAKCSGSAPSVRGCKAGFTLTEPTAVNLRLVPAVGYTGSLTARLVKIVGETDSTLATIGAYYVAGQTTPLDTRLEPEIIGAPLEAGRYKLIVDSAKLIKVCAGACTPKEVAGDAWAAGGYSAEVVATDATAA